MNCTMDSVEQNTKGIARGGWKDDERNVFAQMGDRFRFRSRSNSPCRTRGKAWLIADYNFDLDLPQAWLQARSRGNESWSSQRHCPIPSL